MPVGPHHETTDLPIIQVTSGSGSQRTMNGCALCIHPVSNGGHISRAEWWEQPIRGIPAFTSGAVYLLVWRWRRIRNKCLSVRLARSIPMRVERLVQLCWLLLLAAAVGILQSNHSQTCK